MLAGLVGGSSRPPVVSAGLGGYSTFTPSPSGIWWRLLAAPQVEGDSVTVVLMNQPKRLWSKWMKMWPFPADSPALIFTVTADSCDDAAAIQMSRPFIPADVSLLSLLLIFFPSLPRCALGESRGVTSCSHVSPPLPPPPPLAAQSIVCQEVGEWNVWLFFLTVGHRRFCPTAWNSSIQDKAAKTTMILWTFCWTP